MKLIYKSSGKQVEATIQIVSSEDFDKIAIDEGFSFNWHTERNYEVFKAVLISKDDQILGIVSLIDIPNEYRIHLNLLEVRKEHQGKEKQIEGIAGTLIAFAAENAFKKGYYGFVSLMPKTQLIDLYQEKYGFRQYGRYLAIEGIYAQKLIDKFLDDE